MKKVELKYYSKAPHISMIIAGFVMLKQQGILKELNIVNACSENIASNTNMIAEAIVDEKTKIGYDVCDGHINCPKVKEEYACSCDYYFIRSYSDEVVKKYFPNANAFPLGMNYYCTTKGNPFEKSESVKDVGVKFAKKLMYPFKPQLGRVFNAKEYELAPTFNPKNMPKILFSTRLWDPQGDVGEAKWERMHPERVQMNETRIGVIRKARKMYPDIFSGGLYDTEYARKTAPDVIIGANFTNKKSYLKTMKSFDVCIGSTGLHGSTGWKTAEYVAASKAIILEKPFYSAPGDFSNGKNYLEFSNVDECLNHIQYLIDNREEICKMQMANEEYYQNYLRPDKQILCSLLIASQKV